MTPLTRSPQPDLRPKKSLAQYFLRDPQYLETMLSAVDIQHGDQVLEIGPGKGVLTHALSARGARVTAVELDERLTEYLESEFAEHPNVTIVHGDILELDPSSLLMPSSRQDSPAAEKDFDYKVAANLPYYITSAILRQVLESDHPPTVAAMMVQKEVAERICAQPDDMSVLAVSVQFYAQPTLIQVVPASAFYPQPKVDSAILHLNVYPEPVITGISAKNYFTVVRAGFGQRRKQIANSLSANLGMSKSEVRSTLAEVGIDPQRRAETFTLDEWRVIAVALGRT